MDNPPPYNRDEQKPLLGPPPSTNYPPQSAPYPPPQHAGYQGHPPPGQGYPPPGQGYAPPGQGYQAQGYPPQGPAYVQQPSGFSAQSSNNTTVVVQNQQQPQVVSQVIPIVNDHMGLSIFACIFFCCPLGLFAIIKSSEARNRYVAGDYPGAIASAQTARSLSYSAIVCGLILIPLIIILRLVVFAPEYQDDNYN